MHSSCPACSICVYVEDEHSNRRKEICINGEKNTEVFPVLPLCVDYIESEFPLKKIRHSTIQVLLAYDVSHIMYNEIVHVRIWF